MKEDESSMAEMQEELPKLLEVFPEGFEGREAFEARWDKLGLAGQ